MKKISVASFMILVLVIFTSRKLYLVNIQPVL
jgi:hypothetical protein